MLRTASHHPRIIARGFSLLELIISMALVLVLMLAITKIFSITSTTIGASQGFASATRDARAAQTVFSHDIGSMANDSPFVWIRYDAPVAAFRNAADLQSDKDYPAGTLTSTGIATTIGNPNQTGSKRTIDLDDSGTEGDPGVLGEQIGELQIGSRNHRLDRFSFFARDRFARQTGGPADQLLSNLTSPEAWITYGHLDLPQIDGQFGLRGNTGTLSTIFHTDPGAGTEQSNPQNFYASQWVLGRVASLLILPTNAPSATPSSETITDKDLAVPTATQYFRRQADWADNTNMTPFSDDLSGVVYRTKSGDGKFLASARYDVVGSDIANANDVIKAYEAYTQTAPGAARLPWYGALLQSHDATQQSRFEVNPFVVKPVDANTAAQQVPAFLPACSQFIVEYAGDFVSQLDDGSIDTSKPNNGLSPDGVIDFVCIHPAASPLLVNSRQIQWFGYPRSISGSATANAGTGDVLLLGDFIHYITGTGKTTPSVPSSPPAPSLTSYKDVYDPAKGGNPLFPDIERIGVPTDTSSADTAKNALTLQDSRSNAAGLGTVYAAWGPNDTNRPKMYRITLTIDRPEMAGRTPDGQTFEYVFNAP